MSKTNIIIINAFPKNEEKMLLLTEQITHLKKLNIPILLVSGCSVPEFIENKVDYLLINTENEIIGKDFSNFLRKNEIHDFAFDVISDEQREFWFYWENVNSTITKNIKLGFNLAKLLGYQTAFYTEDDNIWKSGSFDYIKNVLDNLNSGSYKMGGVIGEQIGLGESMFFTTFFFANIEYFTNKFTVPHDLKDWYNVDNIKKYRLNRTYEILFHHFFKDDYNLFYQTKEEFDKILEPKLHNIAFSLNDRRHSEKKLFETFFTVLPTANNEKYLILLNRSDCLKTGTKEYALTAYYDNIHCFTEKIKPLEYRLYRVSDNVKKIKLIIDDFGTIDIDCDINSVINNGLIVNL